MRLRTASWFVVLGACGGDHAELQQQRRALEVLQSRVDVLTALAAASPSVAWKDAEGRSAVGVVGGFLFNGLAWYDANYFDVNGFVWKVNTVDGEVSSMIEWPLLAYRTLDCSDQPVAEGRIVPRMALGNDTDGFWAPVDDATFASSSGYCAIRAYYHDGCHVVSDSCEESFFVTAPLVPIAGRPSLPYLFPLHPEHR